MFAGIILVDPKASVAQAQPISWEFKADSVVDGAALIVVTANLKQGWHLYTQFMEEGGPIPTKFSFTPDRQYELTGLAREIGKLFRFYDQTYSMEIGWYTDTVEFIQKVRLSEKAVTIKGVVGYMVCDEQVCVPGTRQFTILVKPQSHN